MPVLVSKRKKELSKLTEKNKAYTLKEAIVILKTQPLLKFDQTVGISFKLAMDPKQTDLVVRGTITLPHGTGKSKRVIVFCRGEEYKQAIEAGADFAGADDLIAKINTGWLDFDVAVSTPDMMKDVGKLGKFLGPRGLMPNPKSGTVTTDIVKAVKEIKGGKVEFKMDKQANIHLGIGKLSYAENVIHDNAKALIGAVLKARPASLKGDYMRNIHLTSTMGPGIRLDQNEFKVE
jgi:large subunit ribosomal protein L1